MDEKKLENPKFTSSDLFLQNRQKLSITGVEKVFESNTNKLQVQVAGSNLLIEGENLSISKLDVDSGKIELAGTIYEIKYTSEHKQSFFKRIFK